MDIQLASAVLAAKALARHNQTRRNRIRLAGLLAGSALAVPWLLLAPDSVPEPGVKLLIGTLGGFTLSNIAMELRSERLFPARARCPAVVTTGRSRRAATPRCARSCRPGASAPAAA